MAKQLFRIQKLLLVAFISAPMMALAAGMQPGLWEITSSTEMSSMNVKMPSQTFQHCYTPADVADAKNIVPKDPKSNQCRAADIKKSGDTVSWKMTCNGPHAMTGSGTITYGDDSYSGVMRMNMAGAGGMAMDMTQKYSGKRLGDCAK